MTTNSVGNMVERTLELASKWQTDEASALIHDPGINQTGDVEMCRLLLKAFSAMHEGRYETGIRESMLAIRHLERSGYRHLLDWMYSAVGFSFGILGNPEVGLEWVGKAIAGAEDRSDERQMRRSLSDKGSLLAMLDQYDDSITSYEKALNLRDNPPAIGEEVSLLNNLAYTHLYFARRIEQDENIRTEFAGKSLERARAAIDLVNTSDNQRLVAWSLENLGSALSLLKKFTEAEAAFTRAIPLSESFPRIHVELLSSYAWLLCEMNRHIEADAMLTSALEKAQTTNQVASMDRIFETRIRLEMLAGKTSDALIWSERRFKFMENQYRQRLTSIARNAEIFVELERTRLAESRTRARNDELVATHRNSEKQSRAWQDEALRDALTGCLNRRGLTLHSESMFAPGGRATLALVDADNFKSINDRYGHDVGDRVLQTLAKIFTDSLRGSDLVARFGGEEFVLLLYGIGAEIAWGICERLRLAVAHHGWGNVNAGLHVTVSIGLAARSKNNETLDVLTTAADAALYRAKSEGRNRVIAQS